MRAFELFRQSEGKIKWLCSNLKLKDTAKPFLDQAGGDVTIHDTVVEVIDGKKIGMFAILDKNLRTDTTRWGPGGLADFDACFDIDAKVQQVAKDMVAKLKAQDCDLIIAIAHMDGYYSESQLQDDSRWELEGVDAHKVHDPNDQGVDKVLFSGIIFNLMMKMQIFDEY